jgi:hypothetical protein
MQQGIPLPPQVQGSSPKGDLDLIFSNLNWTSTSKPRPQHLFARITWWGDASATHHDVPLHYSEYKIPTSIQFPLFSSAAYLASYLNDLAVLEISILRVEAAPKVIAKVSVNTAAISNAGLATWNEAVPVVDIKSGACLGTLQIKLDINYRPRPPSIGVVSSSAASYFTSGLPPHVETQRNSERADQEVAAALQNLNLVATEAGNAINATAASAATAEVVAVEIVGTCVDTIETPATEPPLHVASTATEEEEEEKEDRFDQDDDFLMQQTTTENTSIHYETTPTTLPDQQYAVNVRVDSAFELVFPPELTSSCLLYASVVWQRDRSQRVHSHLTASQQVPLAATEGSSSTSNFGAKTQSKQPQHAAVWRSELELQVSLEPFLAVATQVSSTQTTSTILDGPLLLINVWRSGIPREDPVVLLEQVHMKQAAVSTPFDQLVGCAAVDLSSLLRQQNHQQEPSHRQIEGRFPLVSAQHQVQGVVKACVAPNSHLSAALDQIRATNLNIISSAAAAATAAAATATGGLKYTVREVITQPQGRKQEYAWSGSDSDDDGDAMAMIGVSFQGAVSCSEDEDHHMDVEEEDNNTTKKKPLGLINQDWMFNICKNVGNLEEQGEEEFIFHQQHAAEGANTEAEVVVEKKPAVVFKNRLLPGVVMSTRSVPYVNASDFGGSTQKVPPSLPMLRQTAPRPSPPQLPHHSSGLNADWLFGIEQQQQNQQGETTRQLSRRPTLPLPPEGTINQFAPNLPK